MRPSDLALVRAGGRWSLAVGRARVDVADGAMGKPEAAEVARRLIGAGLVRGVHLVSTKSASVAPCGCGDCLRCELAELRAKRGRRGAH